MVWRGEAKDLRIPWELVLAFGVGLALMAVISYLMLVPRRFLWRLLAGGVLGALVLVVINFFGGMVGFSIALNPFTAMAVGFLGLPGVGLLVALNLLL